MYMYICIEREFTGIDVTELKRMGNHLHKTGFRNKYVYYCMKKL